MKKSMRRVLVLMLTVLMTLTLYTVPALADTGSSSTKSGVTVTVVPDKSQYSATDNIVVTLTVTNNSGSDITNVSLQQVVPKGYTVEKDKAIKSIGTLKNGESQSLKVTLTPNNSATSRPKTGDTSKTIILLVILAIAVIAAIVCIVLLLKGRKRGRGSRALSLILVLAMTAAMLPAIGSSTAVSAAETSGSPASGTATVTVDGTSLTLVGYAYYNDGTQSAVTLGTLAVDKDHVKIGDEGQIHFYLKVTGAPDSVGLYNAKGEKVADLNDKGTNGDKQAGDGVYSVDRKLVSKQAGTATFYVGYNDAKSNTVTITFYQEKSQDETYNCTVKGYIYDAKTNQPIKTATIYIYSGTTLINKTTITEGNQGYYTIKVPAGTYNVIVESDGYQAQGAKGLSITSDKTLPSLGLVPKEEEAKMGAVTGTITDDTGANIAGAQVDIYQVVQGEEKSVITLTTGENGYYYTALEVGSYTVRVSKEGYNGDSKTITIGAEGAQIDASFSLLPVEPVESYEYFAVLTWNTEDDLDLHVVSMSGETQNYDVFESNTEGDECVMTQYTNTGYGPETVLLNMNGSDSYYFYAKKFSGDDITGTGAKIVLYDGGEKIAEYEISSSASGPYWNAFAVINGSVVACNTITDTPDTSYTTTPEETTEAPTETTTVTEAPTETTTVTEAPIETTTEAPAETTTVTEAPAETTTVTEAPVETTTEAPTETTTVTEAPTETTTVTEAPTETPIEPETISETAATVAVDPETESYEYKASLYWNETPQDLDLHVVAVSGGTVIFDVPADSSSAESCMRDGDVNTGYGPESIELNLISGYNYYFYVVQYDGAAGDLATSGAYISLTDNGVDYETCYLNASGSGTIWNAFAIIDGFVVECNTLSDTANTSYTSTPVEETPEEPAAVEETPEEPAAAEETPAESGDSSDTGDGTIWVENEETYYTDGSTDGSSDAGTGESTDTWTDGSTDASADTWTDGSTDASADTWTDGSTDAGTAEESADTYEESSDSDRSRVQSNGCLYVGVLDTDGTLVSGGSYIGDDSNDLYDFANELGVSVSVTAYTSKDSMISDLQNKNIDIIWRGLGGSDISWSMSITIDRWDGSNWSSYSSDYAEDGVSDDGRFFGLRHNSDLGDTLYNVIVY